jgi:hypothetical protein
MVLFDYLTTRSIPDFPTQVCDREKTFMLLELKLKGNMEPKLSTRTEDSQPQHQR